MTLREAERPSGPILICDYDPEWPKKYEAHAASVRSALGDLVLSLNHVGSTAVPGLAAKAVIDINLGVSNPAHETRYLPLLEAIGYKLVVREPAWFEHRMFKSAASDVNLHVFPAGCLELDRMLLFRDWLRGNPDEVRLYAESKRLLAARGWAHVQDYADAKQNHDPRHHGARAGTRSRSTEGPSVRTGVYSRPSIFFRYSDKPST